MATIYANVIRENRALITDLTTGEDVLVAGQFGFAYNDKCLVIRGISGAFHEIYTTEETITQATEGLAIKAPVTDLVDLPDTPTSGDLAYVINEDAYYYYNGSSWVTMKTTVALENLTDTNITSIANGQVLQFNGTNWVNITFNLNTLSDVNISELADNDVLVYEAATGKWVNEALSELTEVEPDSFSIGSYDTTSFDLLITTDSSDIWNSPSDFYDDPYAYAESDSFDDATMVYTAPTSGKYYFSAFGSLRTASSVSVVDQEIGILRLTSSQQVAWKYTTFAKVNDSTSLERTPYAVSCIMVLAAGEKVAFAALEPTTNIFTTYRFSGFKIAGIGAGSGDKLQDIYNNGHAVTLATTSPIALKVADDGDEAIAFLQEDKDISSSHSYVSHEGAKFVYINATYSIPATTRSYVNASGASYAVTYDPFYANMLANASSAAATFSGTGGAAYIEVETDRAYVSTSHTGSASTYMGSNATTSSIQANMADAQAELEASSSSGYAKVSLKVESAYAFATIVTAGGYSQTYGTYKEFALSRTNSYMTEKSSLDASSGTEHYIKSTMSGTAAASNQATVVEYVTAGTTNLTFTFAEASTFVALSNGTNTITIDPATGITIADYTLPLVDGADAQVLTTNGSGVTSWKTPDTPDVKEAPEDGEQYARKDAAWSKVISPLSEAPEDGEQYARKDASWSKVISPLSEAPEDGTPYVRQDGLWESCPTIGEIGPQGETGATGETGEAGADGADGFSSVVVVSTLPVTPDANTLYIITA